MLSMLLEQEGGTSEIQSFSKDDCEAEDDVEDGKNGAKVVSSVARKKDHGNKDSRNESQEGSKDAKHHSLNASELIERD